MISKYRCTFGLFPDNKSYADKKKIEEKKELEKLDLSEINFVDFPSDQYYRYQTNKNQIVLHHTVSPKGAKGDLNWWLQTASRIATHIVVDWKGEIYQCYSTKYWGHHLGIHASNNVALNKASIGVEIDSWGGLVKSKKYWYPAKWDKNKGKFISNTSVKPIENVQEYSHGFRGFYGFEKYTDEQIESVRKLLVYWNERYGIPLNYNEDMWDVNNKALKGESGVWTHVSYRSDKSDCHPQPELIEMLKSL